MNYLSLLVTFAISHSIDKCGKGRGSLTSVRVVQVKALEIRTPVRQYFFETTICQVRRCERFWNVRQTDSVQCAVKHMDDAVEDDLPFALALGAHEVVVLHHAMEMAAHPKSLDFLLNTCCRAA